jgi:cell division transport system permease protein
MSSFFYFLRESLKGFRRNLSTAVGSIITIFLSLLIIGLFLIGGIILNNIVQSVEDEVTITAYIADDAQSSDIQKLTEKIQSNDNVKNVNFVTKDDALEKFRNSMAQSPEIIEQLNGNNPLPASLDIELKSPQNVDNLANEIKADSLFTSICDNKSDPQDSLKYGKKTVDKLFAVTNTIRFVGIALVFLLIIIAMIFINNTIRLAIMARRKEIGIMRLVGASNGFIRGPFLMEGSIQALIGSLLSILIIELIRIFGLPSMAKTLAWMPINIPVQTFLIIYLVLVVSGILIGIIGSALAMRRYLNV